MTDPLALLVGGDPQQRSGGYGYDRRMAVELQALGQPVALQGLAGAFPDADERAESNLDAALAALAPDSPVIVDGLALGGCPEVVARHAERLRLIALIHHPLADETGLTEAAAQRLDRGECRALAAAHAVVATSAFTARRLAAKGIAGAYVVEPGTDPAPLASGRDAPPWRLLCVASLTPRKDHQTLLAALARLGDYAWHCACAGPMDADPACTRGVRNAIRDDELDDRIELTGPLDEDALAARYANADLFVLPTRYEGYGMAFTEALARGVPIVAGDGGAVRETVPAAGARLVQPGDVAALAENLERFMVDPDERRALRAGARAARDSLPRWPDQARRLMALVQEVRDA